MCFVTSVHLLHAENKCYTIYFFNLELVSKRNSKLHTES